MDKEPVRHGRIRPGQTRRQGPAPWPGRRELSLSLRPIAILPTLLLLVAPSRADPDVEARAAALFEEGRALFKEERFAEACPKLEESQRLSPSGGTLLNVAACHERLGKVATAWVEFQQALTAARVDGKDDRARL